jgi:hypothetical protein
MIIGAPRDPKAGICPLPRLVEGAAAPFGAPFSCFSVFFLAGVLVLSVRCDLGRFLIGKACFSETCLEPAFWPTQAPPGRHNHAFGVGGRSHLAKSTSAQIREIGPVAQTRKAGKKTQMHTGLLAFCSSSGRSRSSSRSRSTSSSGGRSSSRSSHFSLHTVCLLLT